jgi:hypothetical protein
VRRRCGAAPSDVEGEAIADSEFRYARTPSLEETAAAMGLAWEFQRLAFLDQAVRPVLDGVRNVWPRGAKASEQERFRTICKRESR